MRYYKYIVNNEKIALTEEEHNKILLVMDSGNKALISLRDGTLLINLSFISLVREITTKSELEKYDIPDDMLLTDGNK